MSTATRPLLALIAAVTFAVAVAGWQAALHWDARNPAPVAVIGPGETAQLDGVSFRLDAFLAAPLLPAGEPESEPVAAPDGAMLVQVVLTTEITSDVDPDTLSCEVTAVDPAEREWRPDSTLAYAVEGPDALSCRGTSDDPIRPDQPLAVGYVFLVPQDAVDGLVVDIDLGHDGDVLRLRP